MKSRQIMFAATTMAAVTASALSAQMQHPAHHPSMTPAQSWNAHVMAQVFPILTASEPFRSDSQLNDRETYLTQPALMVGILGPGSRFALDVTINLEQLTQPDGEYTFGGWGEGFIDRRHPHTLVHEAMISLNVTEAPGGAFSLSAGKGFAPYGTEDPMSRPVVKFPTNHHLSQILERWLISAAYRLDSGWIGEFSVFGGAEPEDAYDFSNIESFGDSWSARLTKVIEAGANASIEAATSYAHVEEKHGAEVEVTKLANASLRFESVRGMDRTYGMIEASHSRPEEGEGYWAILAEGEHRTGMHRPYTRLEWSTRPEYHRLGLPGTPEFYRYDHGTHTDGATQWVIATLGYGLEARSSTISTRPFVEVQYHHVSSERGAVDPMTLFGRTSFWTVSTGFRLFWGGSGMRMGRYGALALPLASPATAGTASHTHHQP